MARPRKNPDDPKWQTVGNTGQVPTKCKACGERNPAEIHTCSPQVADADPYLVFFAAAMTGLIARGGASMESLIKTAHMYADEAMRAWEDK